MHLFDLNFHFIVIKYEEKKEKLKVFHLLYIIGDVYYIYVQECNVIYTFFQVFSTSMVFKMNNQYKMQTSISCLSTKRKCFTNYAVNSFITCRLFVNVLNDHLTIT